MKVWDTAMDHGHTATPTNLKLFRLMCTPTFGDHKCIQRDCSVPERTTHWHLLKRDHILSG